jgi:hypothetical protein
MSAVVILMVLLAANRRVPVDIELAQNNCFIVYMFSLLHLLPEKSD